MNLDPIISTQSLFPILSKADRWSRSTQNPLWNVIWHPATSAVSAADPINSPKWRRPMSTDHFWDLKFKRLATLTYLSWSRHRAKLFGASLPCKAAKRLDICLYKTLLVSSSCVYLESAWAGPSSCRNDVLLCPQIVHNWRTALLCPKISALWVENLRLMWVQAQDSRTYCGSSPNTNHAPTSLCPRVLSLRLSFFQVSSFSHQRSTLLRPDRLTAISSRSRTGSGGRWSPWPPSATGTWRRTPHQHATGLSHDLLWSCPRTHTPSMHASRRRRAFLLLPNSFSSNLLTYHQLKCMRAVFN